MVKIIKYMEKIFKKYMGSITLVSSLSNDNNRMMNVLSCIIVFILFNRLNKLPNIFNKVFDVLRKRFYKKKVENKENIIDTDVEISSTSNTTDNLSETNVLSDSTSIDEEIKKNIKVSIKKNKPKENRTKLDPYQNNKPELQDNYTHNHNIHKYDFKVNVNSNICSLPVFNLRTYKDLNYYYNFIIHNYDPKKINNLIMCKDIHKWMSNSSISDEDLANELAPIYFIKKENDLTEVFEYLRLFIHTNEDGTKVAFIQKGVDFLVIKEFIDDLIQKGLINNLLNNKDYTNYNLSQNESLIDFLDKFLSLVLIPESYIGTQFEFDIENYCENKKAFEYYYNTINSDSNLFNTTI